jgi:hypothetical protein
MPSAALDALNTASTVGPPSAARTAVEAALAMSSEAAKAAQMRSAGDPFMARHTGAAAPKFQLAPGQTLG